VLAVGDAAFQKKCLGRMEELSGTGRTVLFVSHSMPSVLRLCPRVILLDGGHVTVDGNASHVIRTYLDTGARSAAERTWPSPEVAPGDDRIRMRGIRVLDESGEPAIEHDIRRPVIVEVEYWNLSNDPDFRPHADLHFYGEQGVCLFVTHEATSPSWWTHPRQPGVIRARCRIPGNFLAEGGVFVHAAVTTWNPNEIHSWVQDAVSFQVMDPSGGDGVRGAYVGDYDGVVRPMLDWEVSEIPGIPRAAGQDGGNPVRGEP
jgi:lipopolysaccharide transport system ATP-binding protein